MPPLSLQALVARLDQLDPRDIRVSRVEELLRDGALDEATLRPFIGPRTDKHARRLVQRSRWFDIMVLTWMPGQFTPVHNHAGNCGWMRLVRGQIAEESFRLMPGSCVPDADVAASVGERTGGVVLAATGASLLADVGVVSSVDRTRAIHRVGNPAGPGGDLAVTLHVYSLPHDTCLSFDPVARTCGPRQLSFDAMPA